MLAQLPGLMIVGPRTTGKTTTCARRAVTVVRLERKAEASAFEGDPDAALRTLPEPVLLDEWQTVPDVLGAVRRAIDAAPRPNRFLLTGSVRATLENEAWPATGRLVRVPMYPMSMRELTGAIGAEARRTHRSKGAVVEAMVAEGNLNARAVRLALAYYERFPEEIGEAIAQSRRPLAQLRAEHPFIEDYSPAQE